MQQRDRFDYVLIETTGLANPGPVAAALWTDEQLESRCARLLAGPGLLQAAARCCSSFVRTCGCKLRATAQLGDAAAGLPPVRAACAWTASSRWWTRATSAASWPTPAPTAR